jgi:uncharacterized membrane protein
MNVTDERIEIIIANLLRAGVLLAAAVVLIGGVGYLAHHGHEIANYRHFHGAPEKYRNVVFIADGALHLDSRAVIQLGLLILIATPVARVAFGLEKDWTYVWVTAIVLAILIYSLAAPH